MKPGQPSYTAEVVACYRAVESMKPESQRVCYDPYARFFLRPSYRILARAPLLARFVFWLATSRGYSGDAAQGIARTRYIDDYVRSGIEKGARQLVLLGAGYDSRSYRLDEIRHPVRTFEVDFPATQAVKKEKVEQIFGCLPSHVCYVPIEFNQESLEKTLAEYGYEEDLQSLFVWEGVSYFLTAEAVDDTLAFVREHSKAGSSIIFDYTFKSVIEGTYPLDEARKERQILELIGEPYTFGIDEGKIAEFLVQRGFCNVTELSPEFLTKTYFEALGQTRQVAPFLPLVHADVAAR